MSRLFVTCICWVLNAGSITASGSDGPWSLPGNLRSNGIFKANVKRYHRVDPLLRDEAVLSDDDLLALGHFEDTAELVFELQKEQVDEAVSPEIFRKERARRNHYQVQLTLTQKDKRSLDESSSSVPLSALFQHSLPALNNHENSAVSERYVPFQKETSIDKARLRSTGTTIVGCLASGCVVLGADTRATDDRMVADKRCEKVHCLASNVWCCGAGTSADLDALVRQVRYTLALQNLHSESIGNQDTKEADNSSDSQQQPARGVFTGRAGVSSVCRLLRDALYGAGGSVGANLVLGGYDHNTGRPVLVAIHPHGSMDVIPFSALGSGGLAATGVLESRYRYDLTLEEGIALVKDAVKAGIDNDLGSGSQIDLVIIGPHGANYTTGVVPEEEIESNRTVTESSVFDSPLDQQSDGVNGFGNLPYTVQSTRVLLRSQEFEEEKEQVMWNEILGL